MAWFFHSRHWGDVKVKSVEQFDVPRHTARIDFHDKAGTIKEGRCIATITVNQLVAYVYCSGTCYHVLLVWSLYRFSTEPAVTCLLNSCVCLFVTPSPHQRETCCRHPSIGKATHKLRNSPLQTAVCSATWGPFQGVKIVHTIITIACQCQYHSTMLKHLGPISREVSRPLIRLPLRSFWPQWINFCQRVHSLSGRCCNKVTDHFAPQALQLSGWSLRSIPHSAVPHWHYGLCNHHAA